MTHLKEKKKNPGLGIESRIFDEAVKSLERGKSNKQLYRSLKKVVDLVIQSRDLKEIVIQRNVQYLQVHTNVHDTRMLFVEMMLDFVSNPRKSVEEEERIQLLAIYGVLNAIEPK